MKEAAPGAPQVGSTEGDTWAQGVGTRSCVLGAGAAGRCVLRETHLREHYPTAECGGGGVCVCWS